MAELIVDRSHTPMIARLRRFRGIDTLLADGLCEEIDDIARFPKPILLSGPQESSPYPSGDTRPGRPDT